MWAFYLSNNGPFRCQQYFFNWPSPPTPCPELFLYLLVYLATHLIEIVLRRIDFGRMYAARFAWDLHWIYNKHPTFQGVVISQTFGSSSVCTISVLSKTQSFVDTAHVMTLPTEPCAWFPAISQLMHFREWETEIWPKMPTVRNKEDFVVLSLRIWWG